MRARTVSLALASAALVGSALGGCADTPESTATSPTSAVPSARTSSSAPMPSQTPSTTASETPAATSLTDRLLSTGEVPGLNAQWRWQDGETGPAATNPFGVCAKADLLSIGATEAVSRTYFPPDDSDDSAAEQVADFPDAQTASTAWTVLNAWHDACAKMRRTNPGLIVSRVAQVPVPAGSARYYLLSWHPAGEDVGRFEEFGMVLNGTRIAVVRIDHSMQDYTYPPGKEPVVTMIEAAATRLG